MKHIHYVVRNILGEETFIYPIGKNKFKFVKKEYGAKPKPQSILFSFEKELVGWKYENMDKPYMYEKIIVHMPRKFKTCVKVKTLNFDCTLEQAIGSCECELDWTGSAYPEAFIVNGGVETKIMRKEPS